MTSNRSTLLSRIEVAEETMAFHFERPRGFLFKAGQYIDLTLLGPQPGSANGLELMLWPIVLFSGGLWIYYVRQIALPS